MAQASRSADNSIWRTTAERKGTYDCGSPQAQAAQLSCCESRPAHHAGVATDAGAGLPAPAQSTNLPPRPWGKERQVDENARSDEIGAEPSQEPAGYSALGEHVTGILEAAQEAAGRIKEEARREASELERLAAVEA